MIRPFLANSAGLFRELRPGVRELAAAAHRGSRTRSRPASRALRKSPKLNRQLAPTARALQRFNDNATARSGLSRSSRRWTSSARRSASSGPRSRSATTGASSSETWQRPNSLGADGGRWQRVTVFEPPTGPNNEGSLASAPANGPTDNENFLHYNPYPNTAAPSQNPTECEAGNEPYLVGRQVIGNVPGNQGVVTAGQLPSQIRRGER